MQKRDLYLVVTAYLLVIASAELLTTYLTKAGIALHAVILFTLLVHAAFEADRNKHLSHFLMALVLAPLIRILSLSMPATIFSRISWFLIVSIPLFIATVTCVWLQALRPEDIGLSLSHRKDLPIEASVLILAVPFGLLEYYILKPAPLPLGSGIANFIVASLILVLCTGFLEELAFRGVIQTNATRLMSKWSGILIVSTIFGVLHIGNLALLDCLLAFAIGFIWSVVREKTGSIYGISISHGVINIILFLLAPGYF
ncbi:MAG: CPBP family intramembrane metalloprotease [Methanophagales archaeon ANME-1-THS]|nr:MAG: CPBP family intramembrane metalloprotease [Methanophagales archaeon ANME-1-THS]